MEGKQSHYGMSPMGKSAAQADDTKEQCVTGEKAAEAAMYHQHSNVQQADFSDSIKRYTEIQPSSKDPVPHVVRFTRRRRVTTKCVIVNVLLILLLIGIAIAIYFVVTRMRNSSADPIALPATESSLLVESISTSLPILLITSPSSLSTSSPLDVSSPAFVGSSSAIYNESHVARDTIIVDMMSKIITPYPELEISKPLESSSTTMTIVVTEPTQARLSGALSDQGQGRIEVQHNGEWGTVCKRLFNSRAAAVFCRMLGMDGGGSYTYSRFGAGEGTIWLSSLICMGNETNIDQCQHDEWGINSCEHKDDVSISCQ